MSLKLNSSGGGSVTLQEPTTASNVTLNLPAATGTVVYQDSSGYATVGASNTSGLLDVGSTSTGAARIYSDNTGAYVGSYNALPLILRTSNTERARIDSSGNLLVGKTSSSNAVGGLSLYNGGSYGRIDFANNSGASNFACGFYYGSTPTNVGNITIGSTSTAYNTSSDYRLKENVQPMTGALYKVAQLKPVTYTWKADGSAGEGFIAHELQSVVPQCVTGEKDAVDSEGNPVYQGIDTSFLVATLTAALQEAHGLIQSLEARVQVLEAK